jgi:hypothetical protein
METAFTGEELRNTVSFDPDRQLRGAGGDGLLDEILSLLAATETRKRALKASDADRRKLTASTFMANLAAAAINRVDPNRFVASSFDRNTYVDTGLSFATMTTLRDALLVRGMIEGRTGVRSVNGFDVTHSSLTRMRATQSLIDLFDQYQVGYPSIVRRLDRGTIVLRDPAHGVDRNPPADVALTTSILEGMNQLIASEDIDLPQDAWDRIVARHAAAATKDQKERANAGDLAATALYRSFKYDWQHGGRLYGGWWIQVPKEERPHLTINGVATIELDYAQLHPSILFARVGKQLDFDPYSLLGFDNPAIREIGKNTFARLLNRTPINGEIKPLKLTKEDLAQLPKGMNGEEYMQRFLAPLEPISKWFGSGEGTRLQRQDSDLAVDVLGRLLFQGIVALPVHDSFIVQLNHRDSLIQAMEESYLVRFGKSPLIK